MKTFRMMLRAACAVVWLWQGLCAQTNAPVRNFREACERGGVSDVEFYLKNGADPNVPFVGDDLAKEGLSREISPLAAAAKSNPSPEVVRTLVKYGAKIGAERNEQGLDYRRLRALSYAAGHNPNVAVLEALIGAGADVNAGLALELAARKNANPAVFKRLMDAGAYVGAPSFFIYEAAQNPNPKVLQAVIESVGGVDAADADGNTALFRAAMPGGKTTAAAALLRAGAAVNRVNAQGWTPLAVAVVCGNVPMATLFLENGGDPTVKALDEMGVWGLLGDYDRADLSGSHLLFKKLFEERKVAKATDLAAIPPAERLGRVHFFEGVLDPYRGAPDYRIPAEVIYRGTPEELKQAAEAKQKADAARRKIDGQAQRASQTVK